MRQVELIYGNCLKKMSDIPNKSIDMILADPPYGITGCKWDTIIPIEPMWEQLERIVKPNGVIAMTTGQPFTSILITSNLKMFRYEWIWEKDNPSNFALANKQPMKYHENVCIFYKKQPTYNKQITVGHKPMRGQPSYGRSSYGSVPSIKVISRNIGGGTTRNPKSIQKFAMPRHDIKDKAGFHPTQKPIALMKYLIQTYTNEGDTVLDFAMGSGTTGVACKNLGRRFIGIEIKRKTFNVAKQRIGRAGIERTTTSCKNADQFFGRFLNERKIKRRR